jgi:hypothetical protein
MKLKIKFERLIVQAWPRPSCCELCTESVQTLMRECGFEPPKPPAKLVQPMFAFGVRLQVNDDLPAGELRLK